MATYIKTLKEDNGDITYPQTKGSAVLLDGGSDLETVLAAKADASTVNQKITVGDVQSTDIVTNAVTTNKIADEAVTLDKIDLSTVGGIFYLDTIDASTIPYRTSGYGLEFDIRKYFANMSTAANRPMVFDEIKLRFDVSVSDTNAVHYFRFGRPDGENGVVQRNMININPGANATCDTTEVTNAIIGIRIGSNTEVTIRPYGGTIRVPTLADDLTLVTITDNSSNSFGSGGARVNLNTLYRLERTNYRMYLFQNDVSGTLFTGVIKVYGIKYPDTRL